MKDALVLWTTVAAFSVASCTSLLPMTGETEISHDEAIRIAMQTHLTEAQVKDPTIHEVHEVRLGFWQLQDECYVGVPVFWRLLGSFPLGCTKIIQQPWNEKVAIIYYGWFTDPITMAHEREHAKGKGHALW